MSDELASIIQYQWHHVMAQGIASPAILEMFESHSMDEMRHAYTFAERIDLLGGDLTVELHKIKVGGSLKKMIEDDLDGEYKAIAMYKDCHQARRRSTTIRSRAGCWSRPSRTRRTTRTIGRACWRSSDAPHANAAVAQP